MAKSNFLFFSAPRTWRGIYIAIRRQVPNFVPISDIGVAWLQRVFLPVSILTLASYQSPSHATLGHCLKRASIVTAISPLAMIQISDTSNHVGTILGRLHEWRALRIKADDEAFVSLSNGIESDRVVRTSCFDVYFPKQGQEDQKAILLLPGFLVDHTSYANIASRIASDGNVIVAVLSLEPLRMAGDSLVEMKELRNAIESVNRMWCQRRCDSNDGKILDWSIGGHSFGGYGAMRLAPKLAEYLGKSSKNKLKLLVWAAGNVEQFLTNLKMCENVAALVLVGSNDPICKLGKEERQIMISNLPCEHRIRCIKGGTHNNFASYIGNVQYDGIPKLSRTEQHKQVSRSTVNFLISNK